MPKKTIAVLIDHIDNLLGGYEGLLRTAFTATSRKLGFNLFMVAGRAFDHPEPTHAAHNGIFAHLHPDAVDGVILISAGLSAYCGAEGLRSLTASFMGMPSCSVGLCVPGMPSIVVDNRPGMRALLDHVFGQHGCRRVAYVGGPERNPDAEVRFAAYREALARRGIAFDPALVATGDFTPPSGAEAARGIIARAGAFDALVAANDGMAHGALEALKEAGLDVPEDVVVTGFDDLVLSRLVEPPLTTVRQPLERMAELAIRLVADQIEGRPVPELTELPVELVPRHSCGCGPGFAPRSARDCDTSRGARAHVEANAARLADRLGRQMRMPDDHTDVLAAELIGALAAELGGRQGAFQSALWGLVERVSDQNERYEDLQNAITFLRMELRPFANLELEDLWDAARRSIALGNTRAQARQRIQIEVAYLRLLRTAEQFSTALDADGLRRAMARELPAMGVENAFVSLYAEGDRSKLVPFFSIRDGKPDLGREEPFDATRLVPPNAYSDDACHVAFALPLTFESERLGVAVFEFGTRIAVFQMLREQISAALKTTAMHAEIVRRTALHERSVQERLAAAKRMNSLSILAGGVAHDLNNALGPLVALPDVILTDLERAGDAPLEDPQSIASDVETIKVAALRAAQTIKDLLTLGREGRTTKELLDVNQAVNACLAAEPLRFNGAERRAVRLHLELCEERVVILASEPHLVRAISNLIRNAVDALEVGGTIVIRTSVARLSEPLSGYETIEPGEYAVVSVEDDGRGIAAQDIGRIFEPFFTKKRLSDKSGSGLGLAIVHGVVKEHEGFLNVESAPGAGTTFSLFFPRSPLPMARPSERTRLTATGGRILVVDDDLVQLRTARRVLAHAGYDVATASTCGAAEDLCLDATARGAPYELAVLDMLLGEEGDGLDLYERLEKLLPSLSVVIVSGHAPNARGEQALDRGLSWLAKPYAAADLVHAVEAALETRRKRRRDLGARLRTGT